jgi:hypothetical protein
MAVNFFYKNLTSQSWAPALKAAIIMYKENTLDNATAGALGVMIANMARWAISDACAKNTLYKQMKDDVDFRSDIMCDLYCKLPKVDTTQHETKILCCLKKMADNCIIDRQRYMGRKKRQHEDVPIDDIAVCCDLYGERI